MKKILFVYSFFSILFVNAQELEAQSTVGTVTSMNDIFTKHLKNSVGEEIMGDPFLFSEWNKTGVIYADGISYRAKEMNYNILSDDTAILKGKDSVFIFDKVNIDSFSIGKRNFKKHYNLFYEVLSNGNNISLLKRYEVEIIEGMFNPMDGTKEKSRFKTIDDYFIEKDNNTEKFIPSKKSISVIFSKKAPEVKKYIKQNKLSLKKENDLIDIFNYYNQIVE